MVVAIGTKPNLSALFDFKASSRREAEALVPVLEMPVPVPVPVALALALAHSTTSRPDMKAVPLSSANASSASRLSSYCIKANDPFTSQEVNRPYFSNSSSICRLCLGALLGSCPTKRDIS